MPVRDGLPKKPEIARQAAIGTYTGHRKNHGFEPSSAFRPCDVVALALRTMGLHRPAPGSIQTTSHHPRTPPRKSSVHFCTLFLGLDYSFPRLWGARLPAVRKTRFCLPASAFIASWSGGSMRVPFASFAIHKFLFRVMSSSQNGMRRPYCPRAA